MKSKTENNDKYIYIEKETYPKLLNEFLIYCNSKNNKENTIKTYGTGLEQFFKFIKVKRRWTKISNLDKINSMSPDEAKDILRRVDINTLTSEKIKMINIDDIDDYLNFLNFTLEVSSGTQLNRINALNSFYKYLMRKKRIVDSNLIDKVDRPMLEEKIVDYLTVDQTNQLLDVIINSNNKFKVRDYCIFDLYINTGVRLNELISLSLDKINFQTKTIKVKGKGSKEREIKVNEECMKSINDYLIERSKMIENDIVKNEYENMLFISRQGNSLASGTIQDNLRKYGEMIGMHIHPHMLRHTAATIMCQNNIPLEQIQQILGHKNIQTTTIYAKVSTEQTANAVGAIEKALNR